MMQTETLSTALTAEQLSAMSSEQIVKMGRELISQLGACPNGVNGNIWPGNIYFDEDGKAVLGESSSAPIRELSPEQIEYMAPEVFWDNQLSESSDMYSIALLMYTAYNGGCLPFIDMPKPTDLQRSQALRSRMKGQAVPILENAGRDISAIIAKALNYEPGKRFSGRDEMMRCLSATDEALPSAAPVLEEDDEETPAAAEDDRIDEEKPDAEAEAALPEEAAAAKPDAAKMRPVEAAAGISAGSIILEQEIQNIGSEKKADSRTKRSADVKPQKQVKSKPAPAASTKPVASADTKPAAAVTPKPTAAPETKPAKKTGNKHIGGAVIAIAAGVLVIAGMIAVAVYSLGFFTTQEPAEVIQATIAPTAEPSETTEETVELTAISTPSAAESLLFEAFPCDNDWADLENLVVITSDRDMDKAIEAAEKAGLKNAWVGACYLSAEDAPEGAAGWYWTDGTPLSEDSPYWGEGEPIQNEGGRLMLSCDSTSGEWHFRAVSAEEFAAGGTDMFPDMGYIAVSGAVATRPTPTPKPSPTPSLTPAPDYSEPAGNYSYSEPVVSTPVSQETHSEESSTPTPAPATPTPSPTPTPPKYTLLTSTGGQWYAQTQNEGEDGLAIIKDSAALEDLKTQLDAYNTEHSDNKIETIWLGAQYLTVDKAPESDAGWYWLDGNKMSSDATWISETSPVGENMKLMLKYDSESSSWKYDAAVPTDEDILALYSTIPTT